jgi:hypothetical protein
MQSNTKYKILYQQILAVNSYLTTILFLLLLHESTKKKSKSNKAYQYIAQTQDN